MVWLLMNGDIYAKVTDVSGAFALVIYICSAEPCSMYNVP
jgi:hypothetical protein